MMRFTRPKTLGSMSEYTLTHTSFTITVKLETFVKRRLVSVPYGLKPTATLRGQA